MKLPITVIILAYNEDANLPRCLENIKNRVESVVVVTNAGDGTDRTAEIAARYGARVYTHAYVNQAQQFDWALQNVDIKTPWTLKLDADEYVLPELWEEIRETLSKNIGMHQQNQHASASINGYLMKRRVIFMGRWMRHGGYYPAWFLRLFRTGKARTDGREVDEHVVQTEGKVARLQNDFVDENLKGLSEWVRKHNDYATREADAARRSDLKGVGRSDLGGVRAARRALYAHLPLFLRAILYWKYRYFIRLGFLDGVEGFIYHALQGLWYRLLVDAKIREAKHEGTH